jgi:uncharacterized protein (DUF433 family)
MVHERIVINSDVMAGKLRIKNTRITVELILEKLDAGFTYEEILSEHPRMNFADISAAIAFVEIDQP